MKILTICGSFGEIINEFQDRNIKKKKLKILEKNNKILQDNKDAILFNQTCLNEKMLPKYTFFIYIHLCLSAIYHLL